ncbi:MAG: 4Fe-4S binding protein [Cyanobacteriota bacterium]|nr:4Fe-4S binding protein [Cyanobacteriota bacterium]
MIELVIDSRCTQCNLCVQVCPTNVFDPVINGSPVIARQSDCQTCNMCELYCQADALYVSPDCEHSSGVNEAEITASGRLGEFRRNSGWDEWSNHPNHKNLHHQMGEMFARGAQMKKSR